jgi:NarL family two-component system sensor histidine kinase LiaS
VKKNERTPKEQKQFQRDEQKQFQRRKLLETTLWLLIIASFLVIILQAVGILDILRLRGVWGVVSLVAVGLGVAFSALYQYYMNSRLKAAIKKLTLQNRQYSPITITNSEEKVSSEEVDEEELLVREQVRFNAVIEERQRLSRELHDAVSQQLFAISMTATAVGRTIELDVQKARRQVQLIEEMASVAQSEMRALLLHLRPAHLDGKSLGHALTTLVGELEQKIPMQIEMDVDHSLVMRQENEDHLFRIAQEALSNALRHSKAANMLIKLYKLEQNIHLVIQDDGIGFVVNKRKQGSYGLLTMEERVIELGGQFRIISELEEGTAIYVTIPYEPPMVGSKV